MVGLGAATLALIPEQLGFSDEAMARVIEGIIAGIGFLGAGAIIRVESLEQVRGLTTAGSIWATAAVGVAAGLGQEITALVTTAFAFLILSWISRIERHVGSNSHEPKDGQVIIGSNDRSEYGNQKPSSGAFRRTVGEAVHRKALRNRSC